MNKIYLRKEDVPIDCKHCLLRAVHGHSIMTCQPNGIIVNKAYTSDTKHDMCPIRTLPDTMCVALIEMEHNVGVFHGE